MADSGYPDELGTISGVLGQQHPLHVSIQLPPRIFSCVFSVTVDSSLVEILHMLTPSDNRERLDSKTSMEELILLLTGLESHLDHLLTVRQQAFH